MKSLRLLFVLVVLMANFGAARAVEPSEKLADPTLEARARVISQELRCVVCQNQSIDDSNASLAHDMRVLVRERLSAGDTNQQVLDYVVARYGNFVLLKPPVQPDTWALWLAPFLVLGVALIGLLNGARAAQKQSEPEPLSEAEREKLASILHDTHARSSDA